MKKMVMIALAAFFMGSLAIGYFGTSTYAADTTKAEVTCPKCNVVIPTGTKPVVSMLAGQKHTCSSCDKEYTIAADQKVHTCNVCGGEVMQCPMCGKTELISKA